uniref:Uncharacterized protein n=1 Tax=Siphoviridae sp. ctNNQ1 TaxID=2827571 RepID=A0A8S5LNQ2_9CAUD|nr:MAG TPA: hypothetical protein [Siphoviridae sp. ctNNQ1]
MTFSRPFVISGICVPPSLLICKQETTKNLTFF